MMLQRASCLGAAVGDNRIEIPGGSNWSLSLKNDISVGTIRNNMLLVMGRNYVNETRTEPA